MWEGALAPMLFGQGMAIRSKSIGAEAPSYSLSRITRRSGPVRA
ncbi:DUF6053 domain-containing protein [Lysobacter sp. TAB13]